MAQWVKALTTKPDDIHLISETHMVEGMTPLSCSLTSTHIPNSCTKIWNKFLSGTASKPERDSRFPITALLLISNTLISNSSFLSPRPGPLLFSPYPSPCLGLPGVKWRHLEGDNVSAACTQGPDHLMADGIRGTPVEKPKLK